jgi:hypothetical protein
MSNPEQTGKHRKVEFYTLNQGELKDKVLLGAGGSHL